MAAYFWIPSGVSGTNIYASQTGTYTLVTTSQHGCTDTTNIQLTEVVNALYPPHISDTIICAGDSLMLTAASVGSVFWSSSASYQTIIHSGNNFQLPALFSPVTYFPFVQDSVCKSGFSSITVNIDEHCNTIIVPNVFTPNGDGINDFFPGGNGYYFVDIRIYNRWGQIVYAGFKIRHGWDGRSSDGEFVPDGTYYYVLSAYFYDNTVQRNNGFITLIKK